MAPHEFAREQRIDVRQSAAAMRAPTSSANENARASALSPSQGAAAALFPPHRPKFRRASGRWKSSARSGRATCERCGPGACGRNGRRREKARAARTRGAADRRCAAAAHARAAPPRATREGSARSPAAHRHANGRARAPPSAEPAPPVLIPAGSRAVDRPGARYWPSGTHPKNAQPSAIARRELRSGLGCRGSEIRGQMTAPDI